MKRMLHRLRVLTSRLRRAQPPAARDEELLVALARSLAEATGHPVAHRPPHS
jgi:hypothetical protein